MRDRGEWEWDSGIRFQLNKRDRTNGDTIGKVAGYSEKFMFVSRFSHSLISILILESEPFLPITISILSSELKL